MKILLIAYYYPPINSGGTMRPFKMAKYLPQFGHEVTVLTHRYGKSIIEEGNPGIIRISDISFNRDRVGMGRRLVWLGLRGVTELLNRVGIYCSIYTWWKKKVMRNSAAIIERVKPDVIIATYPPVETLEIGVYLSQRYNIPLITDFRDGLMFEPIETKRMARYTCIRRRYQEIESKAVHSAVAVTAIAHPITDYYRETYQPQYVEMISNAFDPEDLENLPAVAPFESSCFNIVFTGRFGLSDVGTRVDFFFDAVRQLLRDEPTLLAKVRIHLLGEYREAELNVLKDLRDTGVLVLHGFVERTRALAFQQQADLLLVITSPDRSSLVSAKIFEYLFAGRPILALTYKTVLAEIIHETKTGWVVHPWQLEAIATVLRRIVCEPEFYNTFKPDWQAIESYSSRKQVEKLDGLLKKIGR